MNADDLGELSTFIMGIAVGIAATAVLFTPAIHWATLGVAFIVWLLSLALWMLSEGLEDGGVF